MRRVVLTASVLVLVPVLAAGGPLGLDLGRGRGLFSGTLPSLRQGLTLSYDSRFGSSALWWGTVPLRPRPNLEIDVMLGAQLDGQDSAQWLPGVSLTWRPSEHFVLHAQWATYAPVTRWPWRYAGSGSRDGDGYPRWSGRPLGD